MASPRGMRLCPESCGGGARRYWTTTLPTIFGWTEQKYGYVPGLLKVKLNFSSVSITLDLNALGSSELTTVCGMSSRLVQVTVVPAGMVSSFGEKLKLSIFTSAIAGFCWALATRLFWPTAQNPAASIITDASPTTDRFLLMCFFPLSIL